MATAVAAMVTEPTWCMTATGESLVRKMSSKMYMATKTWLRTRRTACGVSVWPMPRYRLSLTVTKSHGLGTGEAILQLGCPCNNGKEWIGSTDEHNDLGSSCNVMVDEAPTLVLVEIRVYLSIAALEQLEPLFEDVKADQEEDDERDGEYEAGVWCQLGDFLVDQFGNVWATVAAVVLDVVDMVCVVCILHGDQSAREQVGREVVSIVSQAKRCVCRCTLEYL
jgi:hypothetical protein